MAVETRILITRGDENAVIATNDSGKEKHLRHLGFTVGEEAEGVRYWEVPAGYIQIRKPKEGRELTQEQRDAITARLRAGKANRLAALEAASKPKASGKNGKAAAPAAPVAPVAAPKGKAKAAPAPAPAEEVDETPAPAAKGGLASRLKISR